MSSSFPCWTVIAALLQLCYGSTAFSGENMCRVLSKPQETHHTQRSENSALNKFNVVWFLQKVDNSTAKNPLTPVEENVNMGNTSNGNISTTEKATNTENTTSVNQDADNDSGKHNDSTSDRRKQDTQEGNAGCRCQIQSYKSFRISIIKVWSQPDRDLNLQINSTDTNLSRVPINDSWNQLYTNTSVTVSITVDVPLSFYTVIMDVTGNSTRVTCTESGNQPTDEEKKKVEPVITANTELLFEAPLLVIGAVLAVIGFLLFIAGISVWRRYRQERRRQAKRAKARRESSASTGCNYEMITFEKETHAKAYSAPDNPSSLSKLSLSSVAHSEHHRKVSLSPISTNPQAAQPIIKSPSPGTAHKTKAFDWAMKGKHNSDKKNKNEADNGEGDYSEVEPEDELDYEDIYVAPVPSARRGTGVATPLAFIKPGEHHLLRKTDYLNQANAKTGSQPQKDLLNEDNTYSHLERLGNLRSHYLLKQNFDQLVSNNAGICHTIEVRNSVDVLNVKTNSSDKPTEVACILKDNEGMVTSVINCEEQNHIYEALEKQDGTKGQQSTMQPTSNGCLVTQPKYVSTSLSKEDADTYCNSKLTTNEVNQTDLNESKCQNSDSTQKVGTSEQIAEMETTLRKHKDINLDETCKPSSMVTDNRASERPMTATRQSDGRFQHDLTEAQADKRATRTSETDNQEFNNSDVNDKPLIIEVIKDQQETKILSKYVNIQPVDRSVNVDSQFNETDVATQNEIQDNARTSNKKSNVCCDTDDKTDMTETEESMSVNQPHADLKKILPTDRPVSINRHFSASDQVNPNNTQGDARISYKDGDDASGAGLQKSDATLLNSNPSETNTATVPDEEAEAKQDDCCTDDDVLKGYTIFDNIVYESSSDTEL